MNPVQGAEQLGAQAPTQAPPGAGCPANINWEEVHQAVQAALAPLAEEAQSRWPQVRSRGGKTLTRLLLLFSYRTFEVVSDPAVDPIVVGVDFLRGAAENTVGVKGDIVGEETGEIWLELEKVEVPANQEALRAAAESVARRLSEQAEKVGLALGAGRPSRPA